MGPSELRKWLEDNAQSSHNIKYNLMVRYFASTSKVHLLLRVGGFLAVNVAAVLAQDLPPASMKVQVVVTVKPHKAAVPALRPEDFKVVQGRRQLRVTRAVALQSDDEGLELFLVFDDFASPYLHADLPEIRRFITTQPARTRIGLAFLRPAGVEVAVPLTTDHDRVADALRAPHDAVTRPYILLSELIKKWPPGAAAREIVFFTSGADPSSKANVSNRSLDVGIDDALRAAVVVHGISVGISGTPVRVAAETRFADDNLGRLTDETGGAFYPMGPPLKPHLSDLSRRLANQYRVTFQPAPGNNTRLVPVKVTAAVPDAKIVGAPVRVYLPVVPVGR